MRGDREDVRGVRPSNLRDQICLLVTSLKIYVYKVSRREKPLGRKRNIANSDGKFKSCNIKNDKIRIPTG